MLIQSFLRITVLLCSALSASFYLRGGKGGSGCDKKCKKQAAEAIMAKGQSINVCPLKLRYPNGFKAILTSQSAYARDEEQGLAHFDQPIPDTSVLIFVDNDNPNLGTFNTALGDINQYNDQLGFTYFPSDPTVAYLVPHMNLGGEDLYTEILMTQIDTSNIEYNTKILVPAQYWGGSDITWYTMALFNREKISFNPCPSGSTRLGGFGSAVALLLAGRKGTNGTLDLNPAEVVSCGNLDRGDCVAYFLADQALHDDIIATAKDKIDPQLYSCSIVFRSLNLNVGQEDMLMTRSGFPACPDVYCSTGSSCLNKVMKKLLSNANVSIALQLLINMNPSTTDILCLANSADEAYQVGLILAALLYEHPWTFDELGAICVRDGVLLSTGNFEKAVCILKSAFEEVNRRDNCTTTFTSQLCKLVQLAAGVPGLIGATLCAMAAGCSGCTSVDTNLICRILSCLLDLPATITLSPPSAYSPVCFEPHDYDTIFPLSSFAHEVCSLFACMKMSPCIADTGSASLLANILISGFQDITGDCHWVTQQLMATLCCSDACDRSEIITQALLYAQEILTQPSDLNDFLAYFNSLITSGYCA